MRRRERLSMTSVAPAARPDQAREESIDDLVPAGLTKAGDALNMVEPKYSLVGESLRYVKSNKSHQG